MSVDAATTTTTTTNKYNDDADENHDNAMTATAIHGGLEVQNSQA